LRSPSVKPWLPARPDDLTRPSNACPLCANACSDALIVSALSAPATLRYLAAYNRAMTQQGQKTNDLLTQAQLAGSQVQNTMQGQSVAQQQANNAALQQNYSQNLAAKNLPLQQLGAFQQGTQANYINPYNQAAVAGPDYMGALGSQTAQQIAAQNAALGQQTSNTAGLYGLGSAGILGLAANPGLISSGLSGLQGLGSSISDWWIS